MIDQANLQAGNHANQRNPESPTLMPVMAAALEACASHWHMPAEVVVSRNRTQHVSFVRQVVMYLTREISHAPFKQIGARLQRDHSTVVHGCQVITLRMHSRPEFARTVDELKHACGG